MKTNYNSQIQLRCTVCGDDSSFDFNEDKTYIKCVKCGKEYHGGYDEVVELNQELIDNELETKIDKIREDLPKDIHKMFKEAFKGNKNIKFK